MAILTLFICAVCSPEISKNANMGDICCRIQPKLYCRPISSFSSSCVWGALLKAISAFVDKRAYMSHQLRFSELWSIFPRGISSVSNFCDNCCTRQNICGTVAAPGPNLIMQWLQRWKWHVWRTISAVDQSESRFRPGKVDRRRRV